MSCSAGDHCDGCANRTPESGRSREFACFGRSRAGEAGPAPSARDSETYLSSASEHEVSLYVEVRLVPVALRMCATRPSGAGDRVELPELPNVLPKSTSTIAARHTTCPASSSPTDQFEW